MNTAFILLASILALLTVGATALHVHNSMEIDKEMAQYR
jgi:hypothetical protein